MVIYRAYEQLTPFYDNVSGTRKKELSQFSGEGHGVPTNGKQNIKTHRPTTRNLKNYDNVITSKDFICCQDFIIHTQIISSNNKK